MKVLTLIPKAQRDERLIKRLTSNGYDVICAEDEKSAWDLLERETVRAIVLDCDAFGAAQSDFLERVHQIDAPIYIYTIGLIDSANFQDGSDRCLADDYLIKPVEPDELVTRLSVVERYINTLSRIRANQERPEPIRDIVTGVFGRAAMLELITTEITRAKRMRKPFSIALVSIDSLVDLREQHTNEMIDWILTQSAFKIWASIRSYDLIARWGDNVFALLLPETSLRHTHVVADRIYKNTSSAPLQLPNEQQVQLDVNMGFVGYHLKDEISIDELVGDVERAVEQARLAGEGEVVFIEED